jgi:hypothetical protein
MLVLSLYRCSAQDRRIMINPQCIAAVYRFQSMIRDQNDNYPDLTQIVLNNGTLYDVWESLDDIYSMLEQAK